MTTIGLVTRRSIESTARWAANNTVRHTTRNSGGHRPAGRAVARGRVDHRHEHFGPAYLQVTVFVAATLAIFYTLEAWFRVDPAELLARHQSWQVPIAAALGALPGCGGAIMVITQYIRGGISFGSVVSVLTATMGDAAFLLLAQKPMAGSRYFYRGFLRRYGFGLYRRRNSRP